MSTSGSAPDGLTELLGRARNGDQAAAETLLPLIQQELRSLAHQRMRGQPVDHTLQTTALFNEAYLRLFGNPGTKAGADRGEIRDRQHFTALAASTMRAILVDHARNRGRKKRSREGQRVLLDDLVDAHEQRAIDLVTINDSLDQLEKFDPRLVRIVELRFFGGLTMNEVAETMSLSKRTLEREWETARAWLKRSLG